VSRAIWESLTHVEQCFFVNAWEGDILSGMQSDLVGDERELPISALVEVLLDMVDRGWIEVCRYVPWTAPDGREGIAPGDAVARDLLPDLLHDPASWEYAHPSWIGALTLVETEAGYAISHLTPDEVAETRLRPSA
jgi:hypothetical protein